MIKPKTIDIADSNLALFGSDVEKNVKKAAAETEPAWKEAGKEYGTMIWRIEKFQVVAWPKDEYGSFYSGDSYIVLHTYKEPGSDKKKYNVHFWLGKETSQDEAGTAAYKTVELDTLLGDEPVQYREVQDHESDLFLGLFSNGLRIMEGGIDSGFRHVEPEKYEPRLLQVKGKRKIRASQVALTWESLNSGDTFVLDAGMDVYVWQGSKSGIFEKNKGGEMGRAIKTERPKAKLHIKTEGDGDLAGFWKTLGAPESGPPSIKSAAEGGDDKEAEKGAALKVYRISDASGSLEFKKEAEGKVSIGKLDTNDAFIVDNGATIYVWVGKGASKQEKSKGMQLAMDYLKKEGRPATTTIARVIEGGENASFKGCFHDGARMSAVRNTKSRKCPKCSKFLIGSKCTNKDCQGDD